LTNNVIEKLIDNIGKVTEEICEKCCKWREQMGDTDELLEEHCEECPMMKLIY